LVKTGAVNVLFADQWDFLAPLFREEGLWAMFTQQHGPHRQGLGGVIQWLLYRGSGWDVRAEAWMGFGVLFVAAIAAVGIAVRVRGRLAWWDSALVLIVLSPLHWETLLLTPNLAHSVLPLCLTLLLVHAWFATRVAVRTAGVGLIGALCTFTGFGFCATVACGVVALATLVSPKSERRGTWPIPFLLAAGVACFLLGYQWAPAIPGWHFPVQDWWNYGTFGAYMGATLVGLREKTLLAFSVGGVVSVVVAAVFGASLREIWILGPTQRAVASALLTGTALIYMAFAAVGRLPANIEAAFMWRYTSMTMTGALGVMIFLVPLIETTTTTWRRITVAASCMFALTVWINLGPEQRTATIAAAKQNWVSAYLETRDLAQANERSEFWVYPPAPDAAHIAERLRWLEKNQLSFFKDTPTGVPVRGAP
jgi:hypothetical protein